MVPRVKLRTGTFRRTRRVWTMSHSALSLNSSSATSVRSDSCGLNSMEALEPLKSYRCATSLRAWFNALSTSCRSTLEVMSNEQSLAMPVTMLARNEQRLRLGRGDRCAEPRRCTSSAPVAAQRSANLFGVEISPESAETIAQLHSYDG